MQLSPPQIIGSEGFMTAIGFVFEEDNSSAGIMHFSNTIAVLFSPWWSIVSAILFTSLAKQMVTVLVDPNKACLYQA